MALVIHQQILKQIEKARHILIVFKKNDGDALASSLGLFLILKKMEKRVDLVSSEFNLPFEYVFLPQSHKIKSTLSNLRKFIISLDTSKTKVEELSYEMKNNKLEIYLTPKEGFFENNDVDFSSSSFYYDLIITIGASDLESLGKVYEINSDFFYATPIINIDSHETNEHFGQINLVDLTATSSTEIIFRLIEAWDLSLLDEDIATCLLTGMTVATQSFKTPSITPLSLNIASRLIALGARREEIVTNLYRTKELSTLKLWGRVLARLKQDPLNKIVWSLIPRADFEKTGTGKENLRGVIDELIMSCPEVGIIVLFCESNSKEVEVLLKTTKPSLNLKMITKIFNPQGNQNQVSFTLSGKTLLEAEREVIEEIKKKIGSIR